METMETTKTTTIHYRITQEEIGFGSKPLIAYTVTFTKAADLFAQQVATLEARGVKLITGTVERAAITNAAGRFFTFPTGQKVPLFDVTNALRNAR